MKLLSVSTNMSMNMNMNMNINKDIHIKYESHKMDLNIENINNYKIISISPVCNEGYPCIHSVTLESNNAIIEGVLNGESIAKYFNFNGLEIPLHYNKYISKYDNLN